MEALYTLSAIFSVVDRLSGPVRNMARTVMNLEATMQRANSMIDFGNRMAVSGTMMQGAASQVMSGLGSILNETIASQKGLGELASVGVKDLDAISNAGTEFASKWSGTTVPEFISAAYDIKGGIASLSDSAVGEYTAMAALTAKATKATVADMTSLFATGYGIYKDMYSSMSDAQFGEMFSAGIAASVNQFKSTGTEMAQALTTLGAAATSAQRPFEEQLAVLGMLQATMPGGEAGTKYRAFVQSAAKAGEQLGLSFVDANNQLLGVVDILNLMRSKYGETLDAVEKQQIAKAFGTDEAVAMIDLLYGKVGSLQDNIGALGVATSQGTAYVETMATAMNNDLGSGLQLVNQNWGIFKKTLGDELAPLIVAFVPTIRDMINSFKGLAKAHPTIVRTALLLATIGAVSLAILAPILAIGSGLVMVVGYTLIAFAKIRQALIWTSGRFGLLSNAARSLGRVIVTRAAPALTTFASRLLWFSVAGAAKAYLAIRSLITGIAQFTVTAARSAATALPKLIASVWSFTAALLANPITWIVLAIVGLGVALFALWKNWDAVTAFLGRTWDALKTKFAAAREWFSGVFQSIIGVIQQYGPMVLAVLMPVIGIPLLIAQNWDTIKTTAANIFNNLVQLIPQKISEIIQAIRAKGAEFLASGQALIQAFTQGIKNVINAPAETVKAGLAKLRRLLPFSDAKEGPLSALTRSGAALVETFAGGIASRSSLLKTATAAVLAGAALTAPINADAAQAVKNQSITVQVAPELGDIPQLPDFPDWPNFPQFPDFPAPDVSSGESLDRKLFGTSGSSMREYVRETSVQKEKETYRESRQRPLVVVVQSDKANKGNYDDVIDMAYRYLAMSGD